MTRRTAAAWIAAAGAAAGAVVLSATEPAPPGPSPPMPPAAGALPLAPGAVPLPPAGQRPRHPATALTAAPDGRALLWTERGTGVIRRAPVTGRRLGASTVLADLDVRPGAALGVRGIAVGDDGRVFASYVRRRDRRLVVAEVSLPAPRLVWRGPKVGLRRVGGGLLASRGGRLVMALGDGGRVLPPGPSARVKGRVVTVSTRRAASQTPRRRSRGWHDPTAVARGRGGAVWIADRAGGADAERLGRAEQPRLGAVRSPVRRAPLGLAAADGGRLLLVCGLLSGRLDRTPVRAGGTGSAAAEPAVLPTRCRYGVAVVGGRVFVSGDDGRVRFAATTDALRQAAPLRR
ncbi:hypothetical protein [Patulibacter sp. SYSU D01012]|uniref:hypothetical protein n=1 Tax=Patulibacter sp. SYSU D01012 TaxID=2817381 RepID=UPI001B31655B|nr:hypothetical protein [Patulibacter sp. SYSU D01012]